MYDFCIAFLCVALDEAAWGRRRIAVLDGVHGSDGGTSVIQKDSHKAEKHSKFPIE